MGERRTVICQRPWAAHSSAILKALAELARTAFDHDADNRGDDIRGIVVAGRRGLDAIEALLRERPWQPIETAPRDGRPLVLWRAGRRWLPAKGPHIGRWEANGWWTEGEPGHWTPTHWMPLPAGPEVSDG